MPQDLPDDWQGHAKRGTDRGKGMAQVMEAHIR
jgi:hypothetical protein